MFNFVQQVLGDVVRSDRDRTASEAKRRSLVQTKAAADVFAQSALSCIGLPV